LRVLVAEDNAINQTIIKEQLEALGCRVALASNGQQALQLYRDMPFDLVLTDLNMPVMNGYELAKALRTLDPQTPIIGVTANAMREEGARCLEVGMNAWIVKPMSLKTLREKLLGFYSTPIQTPSEEQPPAPSSLADDAIVLSPRMRSIFIDTMRHDTERLTLALECGDSQSVRERLHSIAGAMGAVQANSLAQACAELEYQMESCILNEPLKAKVRQILQKIQTALDRHVP
jgi:two-component system capsular synthesis sensor histidine kinase RcsC